MLFSTRHLVSVSRRPEEDVLQSTNLSGTLSSSVSYAKKKETGPFGVYFG